MQNRYIYMQKSQYMASKQCQLCASTKSTPILISLKKCNIFLHLLQASKVQYLSCRPMALVMVVSFTYRPLLASCFNLSVCTNRLHTERTLYFCTVYYLSKFSIHCNTMFITTYSIYYCYKWRINCKPVTSQWGGY